MAKHPVGIRKTPIGWQAYIRIDGQLYAKRFPSDTTIKRMQDWRRDKPGEVVAARLRQPAPDPGTTRFEDDAAEYLKSVASMPSIQDRTLHMQDWARVFRGRARDGIRPLEIRQQLEVWRVTRSAASCNKRRTALMSFYTALNGRSGYNPVRDVPKYPEESEPRQQPLGVLYRLLACMRPSKTRARLRVLLWTGWPHAQIMRLKEGHIDTASGRAYVTPRRKGKGRAGVWLPLLPGAIVALKEFHQWNAYGEFSQSAMHSAFQRALTKLNAHRARLEQPPLAIRPYDLRHSLLTWLAQRITDERALQELALHSRAEQTRRYTEAATAARVASAVATLSPAKPQKPQVVDS